MIVLTRRLAICFCTLRLPVNVNCSTFHNMSTMCPHPSVWIVGSTALPAVLAQTVRELQTPMSNILPFVDRPAPRLVQCSVNIPPKPSRIVPICAGPRPLAISSSSMKALSIALCTPRPITASILTAVLIVASLRTCPWRLDVQMDPGPALLTSHTRHTANRYARVPVSREQPYSPKLCPDIQAVPSSARPLLYVTCSSSTKMTTPANSTTRVHTPCHPRPG